MDRLDRIIKEEIENSQDDFGFDFDDENDGWESAPNETEPKKFQDLKVGDCIYYYRADSDIIHKQEICNIENNHYIGLLLFDSEGGFIKVHKQNICNSFDLWDGDGCTATSLDMLYNGFKNEIKDEDAFEFAYQSAKKGNMYIE